MRDTQTMSLLFGVDIAPSSQELPLAMTIANIADTAGLDFLVVVQIGRI